MPEEDEVHDALEAARFAQALEQLGEVARERQRGASKRLQAFEQRSACRSSAGPDTLAVLPRLSKNFSELFENAGRLVNVLSMPGRGDFEVGERRRRLFGEATDAFQRRPELFEEGREQLQVAGQGAAGGGAGLRDLVALHDEVRDPPADRWRAGPAPRRSRRRVSRARWFSPARIASTLSSSCSAGLARRMTTLRSLPRPARPAPSSLRMIVRRSRSGRRLMSPSRSTSTGLWVFCTGSRYSPAPSWPLADLVQRRRQRRAFHARLGRQAVDVLLADQRLRSDRAARVGAKVLEAGVFDVQHDRRLGLGRGRDRPHCPDLHPVDLHVLAGDEVAGVVEDRTHGVAAVGAPGRGREQHDDHERGQRRRGRRCRPPSLLHPTLSVLNPILPCVYNERATPPSAMRSPIQLCF